MMQFATPDMPQLCFRDDMHETIIYCIRQLQSCKPPQPEPRLTPCHDGSAHVAKQLRIDSIDSICIDATGSECRYTPFEL